MTQVSADTSIHDLLTEYPFLEDFLAELNSKFALLKSPLMRATAGRVATIRTASEIGGVALEDLLGALREEVERREEKAGNEEPREGEDFPGSNKTGELKRLILDLHDGVDAEAARARFNAVIGDVSPEEIGAMEEQLIREGMPVQEIQRLCDLHVAVVRDSLDDAPAPEAPPGHPIHTYVAENEIIVRLANRLGELCRNGEDDATTRPNRCEELLVVLKELSGIDNHYQRKENELFPALERYGITGPSQVMWGVHDDIRAQARRLTEMAGSGSTEGLAEAGASLARALVEMVYKENKILLPLAGQTLSQEQWRKIRKGEDELGYAFHRPLAPFPPASMDAGAEESAEPTTGAGLKLPIMPAAAESAASLKLTEGSFVDLGTGRLSVEQVDLILRHLPVDLSFVDADGFVRYYSETEERLFPRTPGAIGRHVENCHPPKSVHMVREILQKFASGERDVAEFWIEMQGRFIHIRYFAVRDVAGEYVGCLEVTQDATGIRALDGQRRLLEWS